MSETDDRVPDLLAGERRRLIFEAIDADGVGSVLELARRFHVARITIVRDLRELEAHGVIRRVRGGAISARGASYEPPYVARTTQLLDEKRRIARQAAMLVRDGDSLLLDVGTTTLEVARALKGKRNLTVLVTNLRAASELATQPAIQIMVIGGKLRVSELSMVGQFAEEMLERFHVDTAFIGVGGISLEHGLTEFNVDEAGTKRIMLRCAERRIVVADHTKFGKTMLASVGPVTAAHTIITGSEADPEMVRRLRDAGVDVVLGS